MFICTIMLLFVFLTLTDDKLMDSYVSCMDAVDTLYAVTVWFKTMKNIDCTCCLSFTLSLIYH